MKKLIIVLIPLFGSMLLQGQSKTGEEQVNARLLQEDLNTLEYWISEAHGDPYRFTSPDSLRKRFTEARSAIQSSGSMTGMAFMGYVLPIIAELRDGHSQVFRPDPDRLYGKVILPLQLHFVEGKAYIRRNLSGVKGLQRAELLAVNGMSVDQLLKKFMPLIHRDGNIESSRLRRLRNPVYLSTLLRATGLSASEYKLTYSDEEGPQTVVVPSLTHREYRTLVTELNLAKTPFKPIELSFTGEKQFQAAKLKIASLNPAYYKDSHEYFAQKFDELMKEIEENGTKHLILDLRNNSGGEDTFVQHVLSYFLKESFYLYGELTARKDNYKFLPDGRHWDIDPRAFTKNEEGSYDLTRYIWPELEHTGLDKTMPRANRFEGKVYVLINGGTFSAAADLASMLRHCKIGAFVGEETGGSAIGNVSGYSPTMRLKHSGVQVNISLFSIKRPYFDSNWTDRGVLPDIEVSPSMSDLTKKTDPVMQAALALIRSGKN